MTDPDITSLLERDAIQRLMDQYCHALFEASEDALLSLYWPDATEHHGDYKGTAAGFVQHFLPILKGRVRTVANLRYRKINLLSATAAEATGFGHIVVVTKAAEGVDAALVATQYHDTLQKRDGAWRISHRSAGMLARRAI